MTSRFANPEYFALAVLVFVLLGLYLWGKIGREAAIRISSAQIVRRAGGRAFVPRRWIKGFLRAAALLLLVTALARPQTGQGKTEEKREVVDIMISIDTSSSMATLDFHPENRLRAALIEADQFIRSRPNDRLGLVAFAKQAITISPLTTDHGALLALLDSVRMGMLDDGTAIGVGLGNAINRLRESEAKSKVVILLTDGVNNSGEIDPRTAGDIAKKIGIRVYTIGIGKEGKALVPIDDPRFGRRLVQTDTEIDEKLLNEIARQTGGLYFRAKDEKGLRQIFSEIDRLEKTEVKVHSYTTYDEHYWIFLWWAFWILLAEAALTEVIFRKLP